MGKEQDTPKKPTKQKVGITFDIEMLEKLDRFSEQYFDANRSKAANYILKRYFAHAVKQPQQTPESKYKTLTSF